MKYLVPVLAVFSLFLFSCNNKEERETEYKKSLQQRDSIFAVINANWKFDIPGVNPKVQSRIQNWEEWRQFKQELGQKPKSTLNAFKLKTINLVKKSDSLTNNIPIIFNTPAVKSRLSTLNTKIKSLETFISLDYIPTQKVIALIHDVSEEVISVQDQMAEIIYKMEIPKEIGETEMLQALDTVRRARANFSEPKQ
ncbi:hypothetical protein [Flavobacterium cerinum]|uniref:Uncharacterized protein n=1 Tax=Flavobacterium cerinum TaxID=2502784 RepID=A0ABY5IVM9_9FLAO|nr:hypothetical protein [Flavobacterium cerinum]UUC46421.1 hypothetical protein NOX80_04265 [Flavobacterium cerinum]